MQVNIRESMGLFSGIDPPGCFLVWKVRPGFRKEEKEGKETKLTRNWTTLGGRKPAFLFQVFAVECLQNKIIEYYVKARLVPRLPLLKSEHKMKDPSSRIISTTPGFQFTMPGKYTNGRRALDCEQDTVLYY